MKNLIKQLFFKVYRYFDWKIYLFRKTLKLKSIELGYRDENSSLGSPSLIVGKENVFLHKFARLQGHHIILSYTGKLIIKKYTEISIGLTVVTGNHTPTVGIPQFLLSPSHINDIEEDVIIEEDVWIGIGVTLLAGTHIGRGCVVGAKSLLNKKSQCPPYAVVVGCPSRIVAAKFSIDQIIEHEKKLYLPEERFTREQLESIFNTYFQGKKTLGVDYNLSPEEELTFQTIKEIYKFQYPQ